MLADVLAGLEASTLAATLRASTWLYPLVNTAHIVGIALLFGAIAPLDLRLLGLWRTVPCEPLARVLTPVAVVGLILAAGAGSLLFMAKASEYAASVWFQAKMIVLAFGIANALAFQALGRARRLAAAASLVIWPGVITLGRLVGYF